MEKTVRADGNPDPRASSVSAAIETVDSMIDWCEPPTDTPSPPTEPPAAPLSDFTAASSRSASSEPPSSRPRGRPPGRPRGRPPGRRQRPRPPVPRPRLRYRARPRIVFCRLCGDRFESAGAVANHTRWVHPTAIQPPQRLATRATYCECRAEFFADLNHCVACGKSPRVVNYI